jgi:UDP-N-acetylglucosamine transferase subunit ALG13
MRLRKNYRETGINSPARKSIRKNQKMNIALVCTGGGHFEQMTNLSDFYNRYNHFWITHRMKQTESLLRKEKKYYIKGAHFKKPWTYLYQVAPVLKIFVGEKPTHVISTGSGRTALIPFLLSRLLKVKFIYIDTFSRVHGHSKFGTFLLSLGHPIFTQWKDPQNEKAIYIGPLIQKADPFSKSGHSDYIFVTLGTRRDPFKRLIQAVETLVKKGFIKERVIIQAGHTQYNSDCLDLFDFCTPGRIEELIKNARYVITQESAGIGTQCLKYETKFLVMPRRYEYGELPSKSDMKEDLHFKMEEMGFTKVVHGVSELENAIKEIHHLKVGFSFDNQLAIETLIRATEEL